MKSKKNYITPKIKAVLLDREQSLLEVCAIGGIYLWVDTTRSPWCGHTTATGGPSCQETPKGVPAASSFMKPTIDGGDAQAAAAPS